MSTSSSAKSPEVDPVDPNTPGIVYITEIEDETPRSIAVKLGCDVAVLVAMNVERYAGLTAAARLMKNTTLWYPDTGELSGGDPNALGTIYTTDVDDETPRTVASKLGCDVAILVLMNKDRYPGLTARSRLLKNTALWYPDADDIAGVAVGKVAPTKLAIPTAP